MRTPLAFAALVGSMGAVGVILLTPLDIDTSGFVRHMTRALAVLSAALFLGAGVLRCSRWRLVGETQSLIMGTALIVLGGVAIPMSSLAGALTQVDGISALRATTATATTGVTLVLIIRALYTPQDRCEKARTLVAGSVVTALVLFALVATTHTVAPHLLRTEDIPPRILRGLLLASGWLYVSLLAASRRDLRPWAGRVSPLLAAMGVSEVILTLPVYLAGPWELTSAAIVALVSAITAHRSLVDLDNAARAERERLELITAALDDSHESYQRQHAWREELTHDARNALAGLRAALITLQKYEAVLDTEMSERLRSAALSEINHLEHLMIRPEEDLAVEFDVAGLVADVVETQRANGVSISQCTSLGTGPTPTRAYGSPGDVATALQNLLVNAREHGSNDVSVVVTPVEDRVEISVADRGPGLSADQVSTLFQRGAKGAGSRGSGLGLHVSRTLLSRHGGDLELRSHCDGAVFVIVVPAGSPAATDVPTTPLPAIPPPAAPLPAPDAEGTSDPMSLRR